MIDIFCRIIDNFGDAAVVWRLAQGLTAIDSDLKVRLFFWGLPTFSALAVEPNSRVAVFDAQAPGTGLNAADVLVEAFGESPPEGLKTAFERGRAQNLRCRLIIHLEYLTAEAWALDYHLLPSPTGKLGIEKYFFVPGFRLGTGGLFLDRHFLVRKTHRKQLRAEARARWASNSRKDAFWVLVFSYEHNYSQFWSDLETWTAQSGRSAVVLSANERSANGLKQQAIAVLGSGFCKVEPGLIQLVELPFLPQAEFDELLLSADFSIVRGEDSWVRAVLSGRPFLWQAYLQPEGYQKVKVEAFLEVLKPFFGDNLNLYFGWSQELVALNDRLDDLAEASAGEHYTFLLENQRELGAVFQKFAHWVENHLNLEANLLEFIESFRI